MKKANWEEVKNLKTKDLYFAVLRRKDNINVNFFVIISIIDNKVLSCNNVSYLSDEYEVFYKVPFSNYYKDNEWRFRKEEEKDEVMFVLNGYFPYEKFIRDVQDICFKRTRVRC